MSTSTPSALRITAATPDGAEVALTLPGGYRRAPELERAGALLVGIWENWPGPGRRPATIAVTVGDPSPALATLGQLCLSTIAAEIAARRLLVAVDEFAPAGGIERTGRRIVSTHVVDGITLQRAQYLSIRAGRPVRLLSEINVGKWDLGLEILAYGAELLELSGPELGAGPGTPLPATSATGADGARLEDLGDIAAAQPYHAGHPPIGDEDVRRLRGTTGWKPPRTPGLQAAGLASGLGRLTDRGSIARGLLRKGKGRVSADVAIPGETEERRFLAQSDGHHALVLAEAPQPAADHDRTLETIALDELPSELARWLGLAPGWPERFEAVIPGEFWAARMRDPDADPPPGAAPALVEFWRQPWRLAEVSVKEMRYGWAYMHWIFTPRRGACTVRFREDDVVLKRQPTLGVMRVLTMMCDVIPRDRRPESDGDEPKLPGEPAHGGVGMVRPGRANPEP